MMQSNEVAPEGSSVGARLRQARENAGWSVEDVAAKLKMPAKVVQSLESDAAAEPGAPVFVRGQLRSYARLVGIDLGDELEVHTSRGTVPPALVSHTHTPRYRRMLEQATRRAIYIVLTAAIAVPVWLATRPHLGNNLAVQSLDVAPGPATTPVATPPATARLPIEIEPPQRTPLIASMAPLPAPPPTAAGDNALVLNFSGDSWVEIYGPDGRSLEHGLLGAGQQRTYAPGEAARVVLGNSSAVQVRHAGQTVDLTPFSRANVARFTLSSDGSPESVSE